MELGISARSVCWEAGGSVCSRSGARGAPFGSQRQGVCRGDIGHVREDVGWGSALTWGGGVCMTLPCVHRHDLGRHARGHQVASHLPGLEGHLTCPLGAPALSEALSTPPPPSPVHGAHWMVPLLNCSQLELGSCLLLFPGAAPRVPLPGHPPVEAGRAWLDSRMPLPTLWGPVQEEAQSTHPQEGQQPWRSRPFPAPRLADVACEGSLAPHSLLTPTPGCSLGAPRGKLAWWGVCRPVLPGATHAQPQA